MHSELLLTKCCNLCRFSSWPQWMNRPLFSFSFLEFFVCKGINFFKVTKWKHNLTLAKICIHHCVYILFEFKITDYNCPDKRIVSKRCALPTIKCVCFQHIVMKQKSFVINNVVRIFRFDIGISRNEKPLMYLANTHNGSAFKANPIWWERWRTYTHIGDRQ